MIPTSDPYIFIEEQREGYIRYQRTFDNRRWEVHGTCDHRGDCLIGLKIEGEIIQNHDHLEQLKKKLGKERIDSEMDVPVTPEFDYCCGADIFSYVELEPINGN